MDLTRGQTTRNLINLFFQQERAKKLSGGPSVERIQSSAVIGAGVMGAGIGKKQPVHWGVFGQMVSAWILTIPAAGIVGAGAWEIADIFGKDSKVGCVVIVAITIVIAAALWNISRRTAVTAKDLDRTGITPEQEAQRASGGEVAAPAAV